MTTFNGFTDGEQRLVSLPDIFFRELLPQIDQLSELKLALYIFWRLEYIEGAFRYLRRADFINDEGFMPGLGSTTTEALANLDRALASAILRGYLLSAHVQLGEANENLYFLNTPKGRTALQAIQRGEWRYSGEPQMPVALVPERPNLFQLYEQHIGPLTPMIADMLREAEETFPADWLAEAIRIAVENNVRNWRYVNAILERWKEEGRDERKDRQDTQKARRKYLNWIDPSLRSKK